MSRSGYSDYLDDWDHIRWRGAVASALRGKRGQAFLREMLEALDALPAPRLIAEELVVDDGCCALGAVAIKRGLDVRNLDPDDREAVAEDFGIPFALAAELAFVNDEDGPYRHEDETPEARFVRVRGWVASKLREPVSVSVVEER